MQIKKETHHWKQVMLRIIVAVGCFAIHNLTFCGTNERSYKEYTRNFLGLFEIIVEFDQIVQEHL